MSCIDGFQTFGNFDYYTVVISGKVIFHIVQLSDGRTIRCHFMIQKIPDKILVIESTGVLNERIFLHLFTDIFFQCQEKLRVNGLKGFIDCRDYDMSQIFAGINGTIELFVPKFFIKGLNRDLASFDFFMNIVLTAGHFKVSVSKALFLQNTVSKILPLQMIKWSCNQIKVGIKNKYRISKYAIRVLHSRLQPIVKSEKIQQCGAVVAGTALNVKIILQNTVDVFRLFTRYK